MLRTVAIWAALAALVVGPIAVAAASPYLQYRSGVYIAAGFAGMAALALLLIQPLLSAGALPGLRDSAGRTVHRWAGKLLLGAVALHVAGLWVTSPPDMVDALTFQAPTAFSAYGTIAMWALVVAALLAARRKRLSPRLWRLGHSAAVTLAVVTSLAHALGVEGTMGATSKAVLCCAVLAALAAALWRRRAFAMLRGIRTRR